MNNNQFVSYNNFLPAMQQINRLITAIGVLPHDFEYIRQYLEPVYLNNVQLPDKTTIKDFYEHRWHLFRTAFEQFESTVRPYGYFVDGIYDVTWQFADDKLYFYVTPLLNTERYDFVVAWP